MKLPVFATYCENQIVVKNLGIVAQWWSLSESHLLRLCRTQCVLRCISTFSGLSNILLYPLYTYIHNENKPNKCVISFVQLTCPGASWWRSLPMWVSTMKRHSTWRVTLVLLYIFIGPESEHWQCLSMTDWLILGPFDTTYNLTPRTIWHRGQFDTIMASRTIWHHEGKEDNLTPRAIWHLGQFDT